MRAIPFEREHPCAEEHIGQGANHFACGIAVPDRRSEFRVELVDRGQWLLSGDDDALVTGGNLAPLGNEVIQFGNEVIQFGDVSPLGERRLRLSRLMRATYLFKRGQAQKEMMTNSSLSVLDAIVAGAVEEPPRRSPPEAPALGAC